MIRKGSVGLGLRRGRAGGDPTLVAVLCHWGRGGRGPGEEAPGRMLGLREPALSLLPLVLRPLVLEGAWGGGNRGFGEP